MRLAKNFSSLLSRRIVSRCRQVSTHSEPSTLHFSLETLNPKHIKQCSYARGYEFVSIVRFKPGSRPRAKSPNKSTFDTHSVSLHRVHLGVLALCQVTPVILHGFVSPDWRVCVRGKRDFESGLPSKVPSVAILCKNPPSSEIGCVPAIPTGQSALRSRLMTPAAHPSSFIGDGGGGL